MPSHTSSTSTITATLPATAVGTAATDAPPTPPACDAPAPSPFSERFGRPLPRGFAELSEGLSWRELVGAFAPSHNHFHLVDFTSRSLGRGLHTFEALLAIPLAGDQTQYDTHRLTTRAFGDFAAMTEMLATVGANVEAERLHQYSSGNTWCTILRATGGGRTRWAMGFGCSSAEANVRALLSAASLLFHH